MTYITPQKCPQERPRCCEVNAEPRKNYAGETSRVRFKLKRKKTSKQCQRKSPYFGKEGVLEINKPGGSKLKQILTR